MMSINRRPPAAPEMTANKLTKKKRKKITDAKAIMSAAGQYAQLRRERYENHVEVVMNKGIAQMSIATRPK